MVQAFKTACKAAFVAISLLVAACGSPEDRARSHYERALKYVSEQDFGRARVELRNAVRANRNLVDAWRALAQIEERDGNWGAVASNLRTVVDLKKDDVEARVKLARIALLGGALDEALKLTNEASDLDGANPAVLGVRATILFRLEDRPGAVRAAQMALDADPNNIDSIMVLAADRLVRRDTEGALRYLNREPSADAREVGVQLFKFKIFEQVGDLRQAEALLRRLGDLFPRESAFQKLLVNFYMAHKRADEAEAELRKIALADASNSEAGLDVVRFLRTTKGPAAAERELQDRIKAGGRILPYQIALAELFFVEGKRDDSVRLLGNLIATLKSSDEILAAQTKLADIHTAMKRLDLAEPVIADILRKDERNIGGLRLRASVRLEQGQIDGAVSDLRQALNDQPRSIDLVLLLAQAYERAGSIELADRQLGDATRSSGFDQRATLAYANFLQRRGEAGRAEDLLLEAATRRPNSVEILSTLAQIRLVRQDWPGALQVAEMIRRIDDRRGIADRVLGAALIGRNQIEESIRAFESAYAAAPEATQPMTTLVTALVRAKKIDRAVGFLESVLKSNPANAEALVLLGSTRLEQKMPKQALESFKAAIERQPKNPAGYRAMAAYHQQQKEYDAALAMIRAGLREQPDSVALRTSLANVAETMGDYASAIGEYERLVQLQPNSLIYANNLASLLSDHRTDADSLNRAQALALTLRKSPIPQFKDTLAWIHYRKGEYQAAVPLLEEAIAELPNSAAVHYHLGMTYLAVERPDKAVGHLKRALSLAADDAGMQEKVRVGLKKVELAQSRG